ncbi:MAG: Abi family protein [bacterium]|nr:Abi family protein [bacterium]
MEKKFKNLDEQIKILKTRGLIIDDEEKTKKILLRENYFFIMGYRNLLLNNDKQFVIGATFKELYSCFLFDRYLRNIIFKYLVIIENNLKSIFSYQLSKKYGYREKEYLNFKNFTQKPDKIRRVRDIIDKMKRQIRVNGSQHNATMHYLSSYGYIPLWVLVKVLSFGIVSDLYTILKEEDKNEIASVYNVSSEEFEGYLPILANYRNLCAHEDILYSHHTEKFISTTKYHLELNIPKIEEEYINGKNDLFALIIILKIMLTEKEFRWMMKEIDYEINSLKGILQSISIDEVLKKMGFIEDYMKIIEI